MQYICCVGDGLVFSCIGPKLGQGGLLFFLTLVQLSCFGLTGEHNLFETRAYEQ